jgi:hypothetical protein
VFQFPAVAPSLLPSTDFALLLQRFGVTFNRMLSKKGIARWAFLFAVVGLLFLGALRVWNQRTVLATDLNTRLAGSDLARGFPQIKHGDSVEDVYRLLGPPHYVGVVPPGELGPHKQHTDGDVRLSHLKELCASTNAYLSLVYSTARLRRWPYNLYYVNLTGAFVWRFDGPVRMD